MPRGYWLGGLFATVVSFALPSLGLKRKGDGEGGGGYLEGFSWLLGALNDP